MFGLRRGVGEFLVVIEIREHEGIDGCRCPFSGFHSSTEGCPLCDIQPGG